MLLWKPLMSIHTIITSANLLTLNPPSIQETLRSASYSYLPVTSKGKHLNQSGVTQEQYFHRGSGR
jgi:hypothetical protein